MANEETTHGQTTGSEAEASPALGHIVPLRVLASVFATLLILTVGTVAITWVDLGTWNLWIAMAIATAKGSFVALYFMHLRYDRPIHGIVLVTALLFVMLFVGLALTDTLEYAPDMIPGYAPGMMGG